MRSFAVSLAGSAILLTAACTSAADPNAPEASGPEQVAAFCQRYQKVRDFGRQRIMTELADVAPPEIFDEIRRASQLNSSFEDDAAIDRFLERCDDL